MTITFDWSLIQAAFVLATAFLGLIIGWKYMAIWVVGVFFAGLAADAISPRLPRLVPRLTTITEELIREFSGSTTPVDLPPAAISEAQLPLITAGLFFLLVLLAVFISRALGNNIAVGLTGKIMGFIFGALGTILVLAKLAELYLAFTRASGTDPLASSAAFSPSLPSFTLAFGGDSGATDWAGLGGFAIALFVILLVVYTIWRVVRIVF